MITMTMELHLENIMKSKIIAHNICNLMYKTPKEIPVVFHNDSQYDYYFIINELAEEFKGKFEYLGENTEKYITFLEPIKKELKNNTIITYKIMFIDSLRFMSSSLSSLAHNVAEGLHNNKCIVSIKDELLTFKCLKCTKSHGKM